MRRQRVRVDDRRDRVRRVVEPVDELEAECNQQRTPEQQERQPRRGWRAAGSHIRIEVVDREEQAEREDGEEHATDMRIEADVEGGSDGQRREPEVSLGDQNVFSHDVDVS